MMRTAAKVPPRILIVSNPATERWQGFLTLTLAHYRIIKNMMHKKTDYKPFTLYVEALTAEPVLDVQDHISHVDIEITKPQAEELIIVLAEKIKGTVGAIRIRLSGELKH